jgi:NAD(P)H-dependent FMN reductase
MNKLNIKIILGSDRPSRFGIQPAQWILEEAKKIENFEVELLDLKDYPMPFFNEAISPSRITEPYKQEFVAAFTKKIAEADGFIIVTPEYNHGYTAVLKNALDYVYKEWNKKPVSFVGYSALGAVRAIEQLRQVVAELEMYSVRSGVYLAPYWNHLDEQGKLKTEAFAHQVTAMLSELEWWAKTLKTGREAK